MKTKPGTSIAQLLATAIAMGATASLLALPAEGAPSDVMLRVPCARNAAEATCQIGLQICTPKLLRSGDAERPGLLETVETMLKTKVRHYYKGLDIDLYETKDLSKPVGTPYPLPVCNPADDEIDAPKPEHQSPSRTCGKYVKMDGGGLNATGEYGTRESAYMRGGYLQALKCYKKQVFSDIEKDYQFAAPDSAMVAKEFAGHSDMVKQSASHLKDLCSLDETATLDICKELPPGLSREGFRDLARHQQAACYLKSARMELEANFSRAVFFEIVQRSRKAMDAKATYIQDQIDRRVVKPCLAWAQNGQCHFKLGFCPFCYKGENPQCVIKQFNACYQGQQGHPGVGGALREIFDELFPDNGSCQAKAPAPASETGLPSGFALAAAPLMAPVFGSLRRTRRNVATPVARNEEGFIVVAVAVLGVVGLMLLFSSFLCKALPFIPWPWSCSENKDQTVGKMYCYSANHGLITQEATARVCCMGPDLRQRRVPTPQACTEKKAGERDVVGTLGQMARGFANARQNTSSARKLLGLPGGANQAADEKPSLSLARTMEATEGEGAFQSGDGDGTDRDALDKLLRKGGAGPGARAGSGSTGLGAGRWVSGVSDTLPDPNAQGETGPSMAPNSGTGVYAAAGYAKAGIGNADKGLFSGSDAALTGVDPSVYSFGPEGQGGRGANPMGSEDPEDYFARTDLEESLFKKVERRYRNETLKMTQTQVNRR